MANNLILAISFAFKLNNNLKQGICLIFGIPDWGRIKREGGRACYRLGGIPDWGRIKNGGGGGGLLEVGSLIEEIQLF